jgi:hypothetical protein
MHVIQEAYPNMPAATDPSRQGIRLRRRLIKEFAAAFIEL